MTDVQDAILVGQALDALTAWCDEKKDDLLDSRAFDVSYRSIESPTWQVDVYYLRTERHPEAEGTDVWITREGPHLPTVLTQVVMRDLPLIQPITPTPGDTP